MRFAQKKSVSCATCAHAHSNHVRNVALKRLACEYHSFQFAHNHSGEFWGEKCCCHLREEVLMVGGGRRQVGDVGGCSGGLTLVAAETSLVVNTKNRDAAPLRSSVKIVPRAMGTCFWSNRILLVKISYHVGSAHSKRSFFM